jgi:UDP-N-acetyl-D-mannosaminuronic acid dehydrogenase
MRFTNVCVVGLGYIGLPTACMFADTGCRVLGVDVNQDVIHILNNGGLHIHEPGLKDVLERAVFSGNLSFGLHPEQADAFVIAVPTPFYDDKKADMRFVSSAAESILPYLRKGNLVVLESTSPPQTTSNLIKPILEKAGLIAGQDFFLAYSPERVLPGQILRELVQNARVIGGLTPESSQAGMELYQAFVQGEIILTDSTTAEMVKLMENTYRDVNIAIANEFSRLADRFGVNVWQAIQVANLHPRVKILNPGPGVGGHCISVDPWFLVEAAPDIAKLIHTARLVNDAQPGFVVECIQRMYGNLQGKKISALGLAYKPDVDDLRESPAIEVVHLLEQLGAIVSIYEPFSHVSVSELTNRIKPTLEETLEDVDLILILVGHTQFRELVPQEIIHKTTARQIFDTVNLLSEDWDNSGFEVYRLGDGCKKTSYE